MLERSFDARMEREAQICLSVGLAVGDPDPNTYERLVLARKVPRFLGVEPESVLGSDD